MAQHGEKLELLRRIPDIRFADESRGYSKDQVDRVLANLAPLAPEIERLQSRLAEAEGRAVAAEARLAEAQSRSGGVASSDALVDYDETLGNTLANARRTAETLVREAKTEAEQVRSEAQTESNAGLAEARAQADGIRTEAAGERERLLGEAAAERAQLLDAAREEADTHLGLVVEELTRAHEEAQAGLLNQISDLNHIESLLQSDVDRFRQHLEGRHDDVRLALGQLNTVVEDSDRLKSRDALEPAEIGAIDSTDYPPITLTVAALDALNADAQAAIETTTRPDQAIAAADLADLAPIPASASNGDVDDETESGEGPTSQNVTPGPPPQLTSSPKPVRRPRKVPPPS